MMRRCLSALLLASVLGACSAGKFQAAAPAPLPAPPARDQRPNIVYIMSDDHAVQAVSAFGHPISQIAPTPNIDRIARNGAKFVNSFVTNSLCGPSRAAILTGKFGHVNGLNRNGQVFDNTQPTWPRALKRSGYQTALIGKWHLGANPVGLELDYWKVLDDQGEYYNPDFITPQGKTRVEGYATDLVTQYSLDWLGTQRDPGKPFVLMVQHKAPHRNWMPPPRYFLKYADRQFPVPPTFFDTYVGRPAAAHQEMEIARHMHEGHDLKMTKAVGSSELRYDPWKEAFGRLTPMQRQAWDQAYQAANDAVNSAKLSDREMALWKYRRYLQQYLASTAPVDDSVGSILDYLEQSGLARNTIVVYASDQGFYLGEHGWFDKRWMYEESFRTPLLIQYPGHIKPGTTVDALVQNIDYAPTFLEYAGIPVPSDIHGRSLVRLAEGKRERGWRDSLYYHYYEYPDSHRVAPHYGVRTDRYKLIRFYGPFDYWEFYDLEKDPNEVQNRIDDSAYRGEVARLRTELQRLRQQYHDTSGPPLAGEGGERG
jgi:arylsulfatase A-like enzyme